MINVLVEQTFVFAEPRDACNDLTNAANLTSNHVLLVARGTCTFGTKAKNANKTKASAIIIINNEPGARNHLESFVSQIILSFFRTGIDHLPGPDAHDIQYSVSSIPQLEGQLLEVLHMNPLFGCNCWLALSSGHLWRRSPIGGRLRTPSGRLHSPNKLRELRCEVPARHLRRAEADRETKRRSSFVTSRPTFRPN